MFPGKKILKLKIILICSQLHIFMAYFIIYLRILKKFWRQAMARTSMKLIGYSILDIGYSMLEKFLSPAFTEHSLSLIR